MLLTRDQFREAVFKRDSYRCVLCGSQAVDAHHIVERRLFSDGGYYEDNGASVCGPCHIKAEQTLVSCEELRKACGIKHVVLPPHLYSDQEYDKWGNPILPNGTRLRGELFEDESVQKVLQPVLSLFTNRVKYPRTYHLAWSPGLTKDDRQMSDNLAFADKEVVVTLKMDGENTTMYKDYIHARSLNHEPHVSRNWVKTIHAAIANDIPENWRVCGENLYAKHSIKYDDLPGYFMLFSVWNDKNTCLSWDETVEWGQLLNVPVVPVLYRGVFSIPAIDSAFKPFQDKHEGYVVRLTSSFSYGSFRTSVGKFVRKNHVQTHGHWMRQAVEPNGLK